MACEHACGSTTGCARGGFAVEEGLFQGCVLAPHLFNISFAVVINVASTPFKTDKGIMGVHLRKGRRGGGKQLPESQPS